jgi:hypothetical protein
LLLANHRGLISDSFYPTIVQIVITKTAIEDVPVDPEETVLDGTEGYNSYTFEPEGYYYRISYTYSRITPPLATYTVTFVDGWGNTLSIQSGIAFGGSATAPSVASPWGSWYFTGWDRGFTNVQSSFTVTAQWWQYTTPPVIIGGGGGGGVVVTPAEVPVVIPPVPTPLIPPTPTPEPEPTKIEDDPIPLYVGWALLNLIMTIVTGLIMVALFATYFTKRKEDEEIANDPDREAKVKKHLGVRLISIAATVIAIILFVLTEDMALPMTMTDKWTVWHIVIVAAAIIVAIFSRKKYEVEDISDEQA